MSIPSSTGKVSRNRIELHRCIGTLIAVLRTQMWHIVTNRVAWSVGLSVTLVSPAKTAEPLEMPFGLWTLVGRRRHEFNRIRLVAPMCPHGRAHWWHLANTNYFDHLLLLLLLLLSDKTSLWLKIKSIRNECAGVRLVLGSFMLRAHCPDAVMSLRLQVCKVNLRHTQFVYGAKSMFYYPL